MGQDKMDRMIWQRQSYFVTDGQKDIAASFDRNSSRVIAALRAGCHDNHCDP